MLRLIYPLLLMLLLPLVWLRLQWRARKEPAYGERQAERFGGVPHTMGQGQVWFHTVSAGETLAAVALIERLIERHPEQTFLVTTMTPTGSEQVRQRLGDKVEHCYAPYDFGFAVRRFVKRVQPRMLVLMETELWPHLIGMTAATGAPVAMVNARLSERSAKGYTRVASLVHPMLQHLSWIACQTQDHRQRFAALGAPENRLTVAGNVKFDLQLPTDFSQTTQQLRTRLGIVDQPVWLAASTHEGEEALVLDSFSQLRKQLPDLLLLLVPRHPHRAAELMTQCQQQGWQVALQSAAEEGAQPDIWLGDVMGTLLNLYGVANVAFVGGSLVERGGHNPMEPAVAGTPMISGPHVFNFAQAYEQLGAADAVTLVQSGEELTVATEQLLANKAEASAQAEAAQQVVGANRGATDQLVAGIERLLDKTL